ncbi:unnamed protein product [Prorocentrum cordatum]|uniref:Ion transport domain-containing protein n=1 Tax=Prorocentrum cordatum TaxID=2364126 RepID=A0ABN9TB13_9DINO|nr:unnamed protein product [Polarella glacialis]
MLDAGSSCTGWAGASGEPSKALPAPLVDGHGDASILAAREAPLAEAQRALSGALAEAFAGLHRAQQILDADLCGALAEEPARAAGGLRLPTSCFPRLQHRDAAEPPASTVPAVERGAVSGTVADVLSSAEVERHQKRHNYSEEVLGHWGRIVAGLEEMRSSGMSQLHSTWIDAKAFTLFVANPAHDVKRGSERSPHTPGGSLALGRNFEFHRSSQQSSKRPSLHEECEVDGPGQAWEAIRFVLLVVLHPFTKFRILWDLVGMVFCLYDVTMLPAQVFEFPEGYLVIRWYYDWISGSFWSLDILLNFSTGYQRHGLVEMRKDKVASHYIRSWFVPDLIITIFGWFSIFLSISNSGIFRFGKAASRSLRALRLLRMPKINASFNQILSSMNSESLTILGGLVKFLVILILVTHYVACVWYWLADADGHTWKDRFMDSGDSEMYGYFILAGGHPCTGPSRSSRPHLWRSCQ